jgi:hypothetical protein
MNISKKKKKLISKIRKEKKKNKTRSGEKKTYFKGKKKQKNKKKNLDTMPTGLGDFLVQQGPLTLRRRKSSVGRSGPMPQQGDRCSGGAACSGPLFIFVDLLLTLLAIWGASTRCIVVPVDRFPRDVFTPMWSFFFSIFFSFFSVE